MTFHKRLARLEAQSRCVDEAIQVLRLIVDPGREAPTEVMIRTPGGWLTTDIQSIKAEAGDCNPPIKF